MNDECLLICRCEERTLAELKQAIADWDIQDLNELKLITRAGKGVCQGRTCGHLLAKILAEATGQSPEALAPWTVRIPVLPVPAVALGRDEAQMRPETAAQPAHAAGDEERHLSAKG